MLSLTVTSDKATTVVPTIREWNYSKEDIVVVVDGANDLKLSILSGYTVGYPPS